ncbi:MAG: aspartate/glutamate racemase family protein [Rubricella sp.]
MKKIGIIGGMGWPSTLDYYRAICERCVARAEAEGLQPPYPVPPMTIESLVQAETRKLRGTQGDEESWQAFDAVFRAAFQRLEQAGCDFGMIASNTPHNRLHAIRNGVSLPILPIFDAVAQVAASSGARRALILGTSVTMTGTLYRDTLAKVGIATNDRLPQADIDAFQKVIDTKFHTSDASEGRAAILDYARRFAEPGDLVILACTELALAFPGHLDDTVFEADGWRFLNTMAAHVDAALAEARA